MVSMEIKPDENNNANEPAEKNKYGWKKMRMTISIKLRMRIGFLLKNQKINEN